MQILQGGGAFTALILIDQLAKTTACGGGPASDSLSWPAWCM
jgi:hypothetical protein